MLDIRNVKEPRSVKRAFMYKAKKYRLTYAILGGIILITRFTIAAIASWKIETGSTVLAWFVNTFVDVYMNKRNRHLSPLP